MRKGYDIVGLTETNYNWQQMRSTDHLYHQTRLWWKNKTIQKSWLKTKEYDITHQVGGTATILIEQITSSRDDKGEDNKNLGRWSWITIQDPSQTIKTTIITAYVPCHNKGEFTAYSQQLTKLRKDFLKKKKRRIRNIYQGLRYIHSRKTQ